MKLVPFLCAHFKCMGFGLFQCVGALQELEDGAAW